MAASERKPVLRLIDEVSSLKEPLQNDLDLLDIESDDAKSRKRKDNKFYEVKIAEVDKKRLLQRLQSPL